MAAVKTTTMRVRFSADAVSPEKLCACCQIEMFLVCINDVVLADRPVLRPERITPWFGGNGRERLCPRRRTCAKVKESDADTPHNGE